MKRVSIALMGLVMVLSGCASSTFLSQEELAEIPLVTERELNRLRCIGIRVDGGRFANVVMARAHTYIREGHTWLAVGLFEEAGRAGCTTAIDSLRVMAECEQKTGHYLVTTYKQYRTSDKVIRDLGFWDFSVATGENEWVSNLPDVISLECRRN